MNGFRAKVLLTAFVTLFGFLGVLVRLWHVSRPGSLNLPDWKPRESPTVRGSILDRNGNALALTVSSASVFIRPKEFRDPGLTIGLLARESGLAEKEIRRRIEQGTPSFVWLRRQVSEAAGARIRALDLPGVEVTREPRRVYPYNSLAAHVVGFAGIDHIGLTGIEKRMDRILLPDPASPARLRHVVLTLDRIIQYIVEEELEAAREANEAKRTLAIVMQPQSGEILAMGTSPSFDLNDFPRHRPEEFVNPSVMLSYEPGSTFKIFTAAFLLKNQTVSVRDRVACGGRITVAGHTIECTAAHGSLNLPDIIKHSCNVGTIRLTSGIKRAELHAFLNALGFGQPTGIELEGESGGTLQPVSKWSGLSRAMVPIGYEVAVTPLQLITAAATVANGGLLVQPHLVKAVIDWNGDLVSETTPETVRRVFRPEVARDTARMLRRVVGDNGTGRHAEIPGREIGGKTGTAHIAQPGGSGYDRSRVNASFIGYIPALDGRLVILVLVQEPKGRQAGGEAASPVFRRIAERVLQYLEKRAEM